MKLQLPINLVVLLCVGFTLAVSNVAFDLVLQHVTLLRTQVETLKSHCVRTHFDPYKVSRDCADIRAHGMTSSGVYTVYIGYPPRQTQVYCDMITEGGPWLVFQRRQDGSVDFYNGWALYKTGFGYPGGEFWLGNEALHWLTTANNKTYELRVDLADFDNNTRYAKYSNFNIASESLKYKVSLGSYSGTAGDSLTKHVGSKFSTKDQDNDIHSGSCAVLFKGGWWYSKCHAANLNGIYHAGPHSSYADGVNWKAWKGYQYSLKISEMKIRPAGIHVPTRSI